MLSCFLFPRAWPTSVLEVWSYYLSVVITEFCTLQEGFAVDASVQVEPNVDLLFAGL